MAGYKVLLLLWVTEPDWAKRVLAPYWTLWTPLVVEAAVRADHIFAEAIELVAVAYQNAPDVFISSFTKVVADYLPAEKGQLQLKNLGQQVDKTLLLQLLNQVDGPEVLLKNKLEVLHYLLERRFPPARDYVWHQFQLYLSSRFESAANFGLACGALLVEYCVKFGWAEVWPSLTFYLATGKKVFLRVAAQRRRELPDVLGEALSEKQLGELLLWLYRHFPPEEDIKHKGAYTPEPRDNIAEVRDQLLRNLVHKGTGESVMALETLRTSLHYEWMEWYLQDARTNHRRNHWQAPETVALQLFLTDPRKRFVRNANELLSVVIESLAHLQQKLKQENLPAYFLWNEIGKGKFEPKDENALSDYVKLHLQNDLEERGILVQREVEIRRNTGAQKGERTDIYVAAMVPAAAGFREKITLIIETKGCWHKELYQAMETQLRGKYLNHNQCRHGLLLVGWYQGGNWQNPQWATTKEDLTHYLQQQALRLSTSEYNISAFILDCSI